MDSDQGPAISHVAWTFDRAAVCSSCLQVPREYAWQQKALHRGADLRRTRGVGAAMVIPGIVIVAVNAGGFGVEGFAMAAGSGLSVLLINKGVSGT